MSSKEIIKLGVQDNLTGQEQPDDQPVSNLQPSYKNWIKNWRLCKCSEFVDCFHLAMSDNQLEPNKPPRSRNWLYRQQYYYFSDTDLKSLMSELDESLSEGENMLRIHMAIKNEYNNLSFIPIIQKVVYNNGEYISSKPGQLYGFIPAFPSYELVEQSPYNLEASKMSNMSTTNNVLYNESTVISKALSRQFCQNWAKIHTSYIADQFDAFQSVQTSDTGEELYYPSIRVQHYTYSNETMEKMKQHYDDYNGNVNVYFHMGINHNYDHSPHPSFVPVLHFHGTKDSSPIMKESTGSELPPDMFFEYAAPCPPLCQ